MELSLKISILILSILFTGLTAGLCFTWSNAITPGIGSLDNLTFLTSFQAMNRSIINPIFIIVFFGPLFLLFLNAFLFKNASPTLFYLFLLVAILFFVGVGLVTLFKNVPLNELLNKTVLEQASQLELRDLRETFENSWNRWHMLRTIASSTSFILLLIGALANK